MIDSKMNKNENNGQYLKLYSPKVIELNRRLLAECEKGKPDLALIERLLKTGADPLGPTENSKEYVSDHLYGELLGFLGEEDQGGVFLPEITRLFLQYGMDIARPRIPYDDHDSINPLWQMSLAINECVVETLDVLLEHQLDYDSIREYLRHFLDDQYWVDRDDPNGELHDTFVWFIRSLFLIASYENNYEDFILYEESKTSLKELLKGVENQYDIHLFRHWNDYDVLFDTAHSEDPSGLGAFPVLFKSTVRIMERQTGRIVWIVQDFGGRIELEIAPN